MSYRLAESLEGVAYYGTYQPGDACTRSDFITAQMDTCDKFLQESLESIGLFGDEVYKSTVDAICEQFIEKNKQSTPLDIINLLKTPLPIEWPNTATKYVKHYIELVQLDVFLGLFWHYLCAFRKENKTSVRIAGRRVIPHTTFDELYKTLNIHLAAVTSNDRSDIPAELHYSRLNVILQNLVQAIDTRKAEALDTINRASKEQLMHRLIDDIKQVITNIQGHVENPSRPLSNTQLRTYTTDIFGNIVDGTVTSYYPYF
jgi:hypothetical protein